MSHDVVDVPDGDPRRRLTDIANARRFVEHHGTVLRWVLSEKHWLLWDGRRWRAAAVEEVEALAKSTASAIWDEITTTNVSDQRMDIARHAKQSESARAVRAMVMLARSEPSIMAHRFGLDQNSFLFNCFNGTINLRRGYPRPHDPADYITKLAPVAYDLRAQCPTWTRFLGRVMHGNEDLMRFVQRAVGYSLSGDVSEQCFFFLYGLGANGKSTFIETVRNLLGEYARHADSATFLHQVADGGSPRPDIARLAGARFVSAAEVPKGRKIDEVLIKQLTGGGSIATRGLYAPFVEFAPQAKIWIEGNHRPEITGVDYAIWRRVKIIPFTVTIPSAERDPNLRDRLICELPGILNWALAGYRAWRTIGLRPPPEVEAAVADYRQEMDPIAEFIADCCVLDANATVWKNALYTAYDFWCAAHDEKPVSEKAFGISIVERGIEGRRTNAGRYWVGIMLRLAEKGDA